MRFKLFIGISVAAGIAASLALPSWLRIVVVLPFVFLAPGLAFVWIFDLRDAFAEAVVAVALSLVAAVTIASALVLGGVWSAPATVWALAALTVIGARIDPISAEDVRLASPRLRRDDA